MSATHLKNGAKNHRTSSTFTDPSAVFSWSAHKFNPEIQRRHSPQESFQSSGSCPITLSGVWRTSKAKIALSPNNSNGCSVSDITSAESFANLTTSSVCSKILPTNLALLPPPFFQFQVHFVPSFRIPVPHFTFSGRLCLMRHKSYTVMCRLQHVSNGLGGIQYPLRKPRAPRWAFHTWILGSNRLTVSGAGLVDSILFTHHILANRFSVLWIRPSACTLANDLGRTLPYSLFTANEYPRLLIPDQVSADACRFSPSLSVLPTLNETPTDGPMAMRSSVRGLLSSRADRSFLENLPNPAMVTSASLATCPTVSVFFTSSFL